MDLSVEAFDHFLTAESLARAAEKVQRRLPLERFQEDRLPLGQMRAWRAAAESAASAESVIERVEAAKAVLRGQDHPVETERGFWDPDRYIPAVRTLYHGLRLISSAHYPSELTPHNFTMSYSNDSSEDVLAATLDEDQNPFIEFYREQVMPRLLEREPRVLGLSVLYGSQLIPALTLARMVKAALPDCHITMGGGFLAYIGDKVMAAPGMADCFDSIVFHEGEARSRRSPRRCARVRRTSRASGASRGGIAAPTSPPPTAGRAPCGTRRRTPSSWTTRPRPPSTASPSTSTSRRPRRPLRRQPRLLLRRVHLLHPAHGHRPRLPHALGRHDRRHVVELRDRYASTHFNFITDCMPRA